ncbi:MAG: AzlC family ABC transporter permease [Candidatus Promineifilaceae bacterium]|nr:AzlC family ABC transporter permease [Candidatus Promineifilaceae bacterium]
MANYSPRSEFLTGMRDTFPLVLGAIPFGIIYGALAVTSGLTPAASVAMSLFVFAGASQFIATGLFASAAGGLLIIFTTLIVNLRHSLYGITLSPHLNHLPRRWLVPLAFWLTDETFAVAATYFNEHPERPSKEWYMLGSSLFMYTNWQICTIIGVIAGQAIPNPAAWGLDFAMVVAFIGILVPRIASRPTLVAAVTAGAISLAANGLPNRIGLFLATLIGIGSGVLASRIWPGDPDKSKTIVLRETQND